MLVCTGLSHAYRGNVRLNNVSLRVACGRHLALFGHNGSGKSTLLKLLGGSLPVENGAIEWMHESALAANGSLKQSLRASIGVLFQSSSSDDKISVVDNLIFFARLYGMTQTEAQSASHEAMDRAGLTDRAHDAVKKLSGGMRRRLELYRCFMHQPKIVLLDEPTAGLDVVETKRFFEFLSHYKASHNAVIIMASHHADDLVYADDIALMKDGCVIKVDTPTAMLAHLDYLRCSFSLDDGDVHRLAHLKIFDRVEHGDGSMSAKFKTDYLDDFLQSPLVRGGAFRSLSVERPSLGDVYRDLASGA